MSSVVGGSNVAQGGARGARNREVDLFRDLVRSGNPAAMSYVNPDPDPERTPGLLPGGGVPPGETPPAESSMPEAAPHAPDYASRGWAKAPLILILLLVLLIAVGFLGYALGLIF